MESLNAATAVVIVVGGFYAYRTLMGGAQLVGDFVDTVSEAIGGAVDAVSNLGCSSDEVYDAGLCYPRCGEGYTGVGPICWPGCGSDFTGAGGRDDGTHCGKGNYTRGVGRPIHACPQGYSKEGLLCYSDCEPGYTGVGPLCWESCPDGYKTDPATCRRDVSVISADNRDCPWYDACGLTFAKGCSKCPPGYSNDGCTCSRGAHIFGRKTRPRTTKTLGCSPNEDYDTGLCYDKCRDSYSGVGPVCWQQCPANTTDIGVSCQKRSYSRGVGVPIHST